MLPIIAAIVVAFAAPDTLPVPGTTQRDTATSQAARADGITDGITDGTTDSTAAGARDPFALLGVAPATALSPRAAVGPDRGEAPRAAAQPAVEHSDLYYTRLTIHRWTSYVTVPLMVAQYVVGQRLDDEGGDDSEALGEDDDAGGNLRSAHQTLAGGLVAAFAINSVTGGWNLVESWNEPGKVRKVHSILMLLADAAFVGTFATAPEDDGDSDTHRTLAIAGGSLAVAGFALMVPTLLGRD